MGALTYKEPEQSNSSSRFLYLQQFLKEDKTPMMGSVTYKDPKNGVEYVLQLDRDGYVHGHEEGDIPAIKSKDGTYAEFRNHGKLHRGFQRPAIVIETETELIQEHWINNVVTLIKHYDKSKIKV